MKVRTRHELSAAVQVARLVDATGNAHEDAADAYLTTPTRDTFAPATLRAAEELLLEAGLLSLDSGRLVPTPALNALVGIDDDDEAADVLAGTLVERAESADRSEAGAAGELYVLERLRADLIALNYPDLAAQCERVSLVSDWLGYDLTAPKADGTLRRLEVKTMTSVGLPATVRFFLSRNEYDSGRRNAAEWALVACARHRATGQLELLGWCRAAALTAYLPVDRNGRWTEAQVSLPVAALIPAFPAAV